MYSSVLCYLCKCRVHDPDSLPIRVLVEKSFAPVRCCWPRLGREKAVQSLPSRWWSHCTSWGRYPCTASWTLSWGRPTVSCSLDPSRSCVPLKPTLLEAVHNSSRLLQALWMTVNTSKPGAYDFCSDLPPELEERHYCRLHSKIPQRDDTSPQHLQKQTTVPTLDILGYNLSSARPRRDTMIQ